MLFRSGAHNHIYTYAQVIAQPKICKDDETGIYTKGICGINTLRGARDIGNNIDNIKFDCPCIMSGVPDKIKEMAEWNVNDMVEIKGVITTRQANKNSFCTHCHNKNTIQGIITYINPVYLSKRETNISKEQGYELLKKRCEISNSVTLVGKLVRDPEYYSSDKGVKSCQYQIAVKRKYRLKDDSQENKVDFIWIKTFGSNAESDAKSLRKGSLILIDGILQTRGFDREVTCVHCGSTYTMEESVLEVIPYTVEYLQDFVTKEELDKIKEEKLQKALNILN